MAHVFFSLLSFSVLITFYRPFLLHNRLVNNKTPLSTTSYLNAHLVQTRYLDRKSMIGDSDHPLTIGWAKGSRLKLKGWTARYGSAVTACWDLRADPDKKWYVYRKVMFDSSYPANSNRLITQKSMTFVERLSRAENEEDNTTRCHLVNIQQKLSEKLIMSNSS